VWTGVIVSTDDTKDGVERAALYLTWTGAMCRLGAKQHSRVEARRTLGTVTTVCRQTFVM